MAIRKLIKRGRAAHIILTISSSTIAAVSFSVWCFFREGDLNWAAGQTALIAGSCAIINGLQWLANWWLERKEKQHDEIVSMTLQDMVDKSPALAAKINATTCELTLPRAELLQAERDRMMKITGGTAILTAIVAATLTILDYCNSDTGAELIPVSVAFLAVLFFPGVALFAQLLVYVLYKKTLPWKIFFSDDNIFVDDHHFHANKSMRITITDPKAAKSDRRDSPSFHTLKILDFGNKYMWRIDAFSKETGAAVYVDYEELVARLVAWGKRYDVDVRYEEPFGDQQ